MWRQLSHHTATLQSTNPDRNVPPAEPKKIVLFSNQCSKLYEGLPATGTSLIKRRQTAGAVSGGFLRRRRRWKQKEGAEGMIKH